MIASKIFLVICDYYKYFSDVNKEHVPMIKFYDDKNSKCYVTAMPGPVGKLIRKDILVNNNIMFLENHLFEDNAIMPFVCALSKKTKYINRPYYYYVQHMGSALNQKKYDLKYRAL